MRVVILSVIIFINFILRATWFQSIEIFGVIPNTTLLIVVCYAVLRGDAEGSVVGFFAGLIHDIFFFGSYFGFFTLTAALIGYFCGKPFRDFYRENYLIPLVLAGTSSLAYGFIYYILHYLPETTAGANFWQYIYLKILPETLYTIILAVPVYRIFYGINGRLERYETRRRY